MRRTAVYFFLFSFLFTSLLFSQNQGKKWYFGNQAGLDFMSGSPVVLTNGAMNCSEGTAVISDAAGNLLFYTDGITIYNANHVAMTNGVGMAATGNACQSSLIVKQPGSNTIYYVFLLQGNGGDFYYSIVDMSLSGGLGAVTTTSNVVITTNVTEKLTATRHCNGTDVWIVIHDWGNNTFMSYLLTATGINPPVLSSVGTTHSGTVNNVLGCMKISPTGRKLGLGIWASIYTFELYDFDNVTGVVSNPIILGTNFAQAYGVEFSPDGSKFYGCCETNVGTSIYQWDLCAGNSAAIIASQYTVAAASLGVVRNGMQVATDGKIYVARNTQSSLGVINSPNLAGAACNYVDVGQTLGSQISTRGLPNFINSLFKQAPAPITYTTNAALGCLNATLSCASNAATQIGCPSAGYSVTSFYWKFGDPASGTANTSTLLVPTHAYPAPGTYTAQLVLNYSCGGGTDTVTKAIVISSPSLTCNSATATCNGLGAATVTAAGSSGLSSYTWTPTGLTSSVISNVTPGTYTINMSDASGCTASLVTNVVTPINATPVLSVTSASICPGAAASLTVSGASSYTWNPGNFTGNNFVVTPTINTTYTVLGLASGCTTQITSSVGLKSLPVASITCNSTVCSGQVLQFAGTGGLSYLWSGPATYTSNLQNPSFAQSSATNTGVYTLTVTAVNNCTASTTVSVQVNPVPTLAITSSTVCVAQTLSLSVNTGTSTTTFNWTGPNSFTSSLQNVLIVNSGTVMSGIYQVTVTNTQNCSSSASVNALVVTAPVPTILTNAPICEGTVLSFTAGGGQTYTWAGPNSFTSSLQSPSISAPSGLANGVYTLTASNGYCSVNAIKPISLYSVPALTLVSNSPVCETKSLSLSANTGSGVVSYTWNGPAAFKDSVQITVRDSCKLFYSGNYSLTVTDMNGCRSTVVQSLTVLPKPLLSVAGATVCLHDSAALKASGANTYTWSGPGSYISYNPNPVIANAGNISPYEYTLVASAVNQCTSVAKVILATLPLPLPSLTLSASRVCANSTVFLKGDGGATYLWTGPGNIKFTEKDVSFVAYNTGGNLTYSLDVTDSLGCHSSTTAIVQVDPLPFGTLAGNNSNCIPFCTEITFNAGSTTALSDYAWQLNDEIYSGQKFKKCFTSAGEFSLRGKFTDVNNCSTTASFVINAYAKPKADFYYLPENLIENTESVVFINKSSGQSLNQWTWYFSDNEHKVTAKNTSWYYNEAGSFAVAMVVKNEWGCADSVVKVVTVQQDFHTYVPNAFTPNNDGLNDLFLPVGRGVKTYHLSVFNRWGTEVFESTELSTGWDGTYNGEPCTSDVYIWKILISSNAGETREMRGNVSLVR